MNAFFSSRTASAVLLGIGLMVSQMSNAFSQQNFFGQDWRWIHFNRESGLASNHIFNLVETSDSTVWVATAGGLSWFDGYLWNSLDSSLSPPRGTFSSFHATTTNRIVAVVQNTGFVGDKTGFRLLANMLVQYAVPFSGDSVLFVSNDRLYLSANQNVFPFERANTESLGPVIDLRFTTGRSIWICTASVLYKWEGDEWVPKFRTPSTRLKLALRAFDENARGEVYAAIDLPLDAWGSWEWNSGSKPHLTRGGARASLRTASISSKGQVLAIYASGLKLVRVDGTWHRIDQLHRDIREIEFVHHRLNDDVWFGTQQGLFLYRSSSARWSYMNDVTPSARGSINEFLMTKKNELWIATSSGVEVHKQNGETIVFDEIGGDQLYMVTGLEEDNANNIWISSGGSFDGAYRWNGKTWKQYGRRTPLDGKRIHKIRKDRFGRLWFLSIWPGRLNPASDVSLGADVFADTGFVEHWGTKDGLPNEQVYAFAHSASGAYWFGTIGGLSRYNNGVWKHWRSDTTRSSAPKPTNGPVARVFTIALDALGNTWVGDRMNGLVCIDSRDSLKQYTTDDGLINNEVWDVRCDSLGRVWIATNGGLSCYWKDTWTSFTSRDGLLSAELWPVLPVGNTVYVGARGVGVSILNLSELPAESPLNQLDEPAKQERGTVFKWQARGFWGEPAGEKILSRYSLDYGAWSNWSTSTAKTISDLTPGDHVIAVQSLGFVGSMKEQGARRSFRIEEPFYRNPLFLLSTVGLTLLTAFLGISSFVRKKKHDARLRASEAKFRAITETTSSAILIYDRHKILFANPEAESLTGFSIDELMRMSTADVFGVNSSSLLVTAAGFEGRRSQRIEMKFERKSGEERWIDYSEGPIDFYGVDATVGTGFDITERKKAEEAVLANREQLRSLASELSQTEERERRRMATFLHDTIGQALALCKIKLSALQRAAEAKQLQQSLAEIRSYLDQSIQNTRSLTFELSPPILHELGLVAALEWLAEHMEAQHGIKISCTDDGKAKRVSDELRPLLFHAVRELLINVVKHAQASCVNIETKREQDAIVIVVNDNGIGVDLEATTSRSKHGGFGLFNIRERLSFLGGRMEVVSPASGGTQIQLSAPLDTKEGSKETTVYG